MACYSWKPKHSEKILRKRRFIHQTLVMIIEDTLVCLMGVLLALLVPGQSLSGVINKITVCITVFACFLQFIASFYPSCVFYRTQKREPTRCMHCISSNPATRSHMVCYFIILAAIAWSTAFMKFNFVFYAPSMGEDGVTVSILGTKIETVILNDVFALLFGILLVYLIYACIIFGCIRCCSLDNGTLRRNLTLKEFCCILCCCRVPND